MSISRRNFIRASASAAGTGLVLSSALPKPVLAAEEDHRACPVEPQPIPHTIATPFGTTIHHFFPGPVEGADPVTGHDPSEIFDFSGVIAQADLLLSGTGTDLNTGDSAPYDFHTDMRFMKGQFVAADGHTHKGAFAFIWLDSLPAASPLGLHSYDAAVSPTLVTWVTPIPEGGARSDLDDGTAELHVRNICSVFDAFSVANSLDPTHPLGNVVSAVIDSLDLKWGGVTRSIIGFSDPVNQFSGDFFETSASIHVSVRTKMSTGHGFRFVSSATTKVNFAQIGRETNGVYFWHMHLTAARAQASSRSCRDDYCRSLPRYDTHIDRLHRSISPPTTPVFTVRWITPGVRAYKGLGFDAEGAITLSAAHTKNFM